MKGFALWWYCSPAYLSYLTKPGSTSLQLSTASSQISDYIQDTSALLPIPPQLVNLFNVSDVLHEYTYALSYTLHSADGSLIIGPALPTPDSRLAPWVTMVSAAVPATPLECTDPKHHQLSGTTRLIPKFKACCFWQAFNTQNQNQFSSPTPHISKTDTPTKPCSIFWHGFIILLCSSLENLKCNVYMFVYTGVHSRILFKLNVLSLHLT